MELRSIRTLGLALLLATASLGCGRAPATGPPDPVLLERAEAAVLLDSTDEGETLGEAVTPPPETP